MHNVRAYERSTNRQQSVVKIIRFRDFFPVYLQLYVKKYVICIMAEKKLLTKLIVFWMLFSKDILNYLK